jgi:hypothetical protein
MATIPNPLRSGEYTLYGGTYSGDVGSIYPNPPPTLTLKHNAVANVTVMGLGDPIQETGYAHTAIFDVFGRDTLNLTLGGGRLSPYGAGFATINLEPGARLTGNVRTTLDGFLTVNGGHGARLVNYSGTLNGGSVTIHTAVDGHGSFTLGSGSPSSGASLELGGRVSGGETVTVTAGDLLLDQPMAFHGELDWAPTAADPTSSVYLSGVQADSYAIDRGKLHLFMGKHDFLDIRFAQAPNTALHVSENSGGITLSVLDPQYLHNGSVALPMHQIA